MLFVLQGIILEVIRKYAEGVRLLAVAIPSRAFPLFKDRRVCQRVFVYSMDSLLDSACFRFDVLSLKRKETIDRFHIS